MNNLLFCNQFFRAVWGAGKTDAEVPLVWEAPVTPMSVSIACHIQTLNPWIVSFNNENSLCWAEAVPWRGMFTAVLKKTKLVWQQKKDQKSTHSLPPLLGTLASKHDCLKGRVTASECDVISSVLPPLLPGLKPFSFGSRTQQVEPRKSSFL